MQHPTTSSLPSWECGLKSNFCILIICRNSHSLLGSVDWNKSLYLYFANGKSHSLLGSVDWNWHPALKADMMPRHSLLGSVDWNCLKTFIFSRKCGHSLLGSVDWNSQHSWLLQMCRVTPFLGVWIEIDEKRHKDHAGEPSLPSWECGLKFYYTKKSEDLQQSLPSWECGLKWNLHRY